MVTYRNIEFSKRGDILDTKGKVLAFSVKQYTVFIDPNRMDNLSKMRQILSKNGIQLNNTHLKKLKITRTSYVPIAYNVDSKTIRNIKKAKINGIGFHSTYVRKYPLGQLCSNIIGITDIDGHGLEGIERICEKCLRGNCIKVHMLRDGRGNIIQKDKHIDKTKMKGHNITLHIDATIQLIVTHELQKAILKFRAKKAVCIIQNPRTGAILSMVSIPSFNPNKKINNINTLRNSAISNVYEPGSTFKIVTVSTALDTGLVQLSDNFYLNNSSYKLAGHIIKDNHKKVNRFISLSEAIEYSSNIIMSQLAQKIGTKNFYKYIRNFGFYSLTGIDLSGEEKGLLSNINKIHPLSLCTISFGQGIGVTAIQIISAFSTIANDGVLMKPLLIKKIDNTNLKQQVIRRVISANTAKVMKRILKNAVDFGTGHSGKINGYSMGGKTGTAQKIDHLTKSYSKTAYTASFCGLIPAMNPKLVILVIIDEPCGNYYASSVASPVFARIAEKVLQYLEIAKDENKFNILI
ncbi:MAG: penicillin-binding protein 2 [Endomicrobium sp.]|jgi:cell division protein FtsI (penicillin-binding protein 3)|nr:penicillin-binding protein 2 [Endomicrobium sp.]